jgi:type VI secretion system protein ImpK
MSDPPFNRSDRTIIRPNPGGRRPTAPTPATPAPPPQSYQPPPSPMPSYPQPPAPTGGSGNPEDWVRTAPVQPPPETAQQALILKRDVPVAANENILLEASSPILLLLGRLRVSLMSANFANLMSQVADAIEEFEQKLRRASVPEAQARQAAYVLCATADDIVQNIPSEQRHYWTQYSMLAKFFGERTGGVRFFEELERAKADPSSNYSVLELMYACLALGFQGIHRTGSGGAAQLQMIQRNLYELLRRTRPRTDSDLSPHWRGQDIPPPVTGFRIPFWAPVAVVASLVFLMFIGMRVLLSSDTDTVTVEMRRLFPESALALERIPIPVAAPVAGPRPPPPPPIEPPKPPGPTQLERIRAVLAEEIAAKKADALENGASIVIRVGNLTTFPSGSATVLESFKAVGNKIAAALDKEPGDIRITGHTDNVAIATIRFPSNYELSLERAKAVAAVIKPGIADGGRLKVDGKADTQPVAPNDTEDGRSRNRRVEISIPREETLRKP